MKNFYYIESETVLREDKELYEYAVYSFFNSNTNSAYTDYR